MNLDVFNGDAFHLIPLSQAMSLMPYQPTRIRELGYFGEEGINTVTMMVEMEQGVLSLVPTAPRGSAGKVETLGRRNVRPFMSVHLPQRVSLAADEVQGLRAFGSQTETEVAMDRLNKKLAFAKRNLDLTIEYQRIGAIKGKILDSDGSTVITDLFSEFGVSQSTKDMALDNAGTQVFLKFIELRRQIEDALGASTYSQIRVLCSSGFYDALSQHTAIIDSFKYQMAQVTRADNRKGFEPTPGIIFEEYRGLLNGNAFIDANCAYAIPEGVPDLFKTYYSPADMMSTVNTMGLPYYASIELMDHEKGVDVLTQSNPLHLCNRPAAIVKLGKNAAALA